MIKHDDLKDKVALITGSTKGIGLAIAKRITLEGGAVILNGRDEEAGEKALKQIKHLGGRAILSTGNIMDKSFVHKMIEDGVKEFEKIDILVNNAGGAFQWGPFHELAEENWDYIINMYYRSRLICTKAILSQMIEQQQGSIVNLVTDAGRLGAPLEAVFAGTMGAVIAWSKSLAREMTRYRIRVNCVSFTAVEGTELYNYGRQGPYVEKLIRSIAEKTPLGLSKPEDIANAVAYFASDESKQVTGQVFSINGGLSFAG